jgi:hypothetical protein
MLLIEVLVRISLARILGLSPCLYIRIRAWLFYLICLVYCLKIVV